MNRQNFLQDLLDAFKAAGVNETIRFEYRSVQIISYKPSMIRALAKMQGFKIFSSPWPECVILKRADLQVKSTYKDVPEHECWKVENVEDFEALRDILFNRPQFEYLEKYFLYGSATMEMMFRHTSGLYFMISWRRDATFPESR